MADFAYAVHTDVCTYLLDETGVCLWVLSPAQSTASAVKSCVGAHFMACIDPSVPGALVGELMEGAAALFVSVNKESLRPSLLRTGVIRRVQERHPSQVQALLEPTIEDIDVHFEDDVSQRQTVEANTREALKPAAPPEARESETATTPIQVPPPAPPEAELAARRSEDLSSLDRPTEPRQSPLSGQSPAELSAAQPPPCPDLPEAAIPSDLPKAAPTLLIDLPKQQAAEAASSHKDHAHGPPPLPKMPPAGPPPLPKNVAHTPAPPPLPSGSFAHTPLPPPLPPPLPLAHTPIPPPLPKVQGVTPPPLPGQLTHSPLPPPLPKNAAHTPTPPPLHGLSDRSQVPPPVWITHTAQPEASPALPLPPVLFGAEASDAQAPKDESSAAEREQGGKTAGSRLPKRKSSPDNSGAPPMLSSPRSRSAQPASKVPKQPASKKVPPPPLPPPPRSLAGARSSAFDENAPLPLRRRKKKD